MSLAVYSNHLQHLASTTSSSSGSAIRHGHGPILLSPTQPIEHHIMNLIILIKCTCHSVSIQLLSHKIGLYLAATVMPKTLKSITEINNKLQHADIVKAGVKYSIRFLLNFFEIVLVWRNPTNLWLNLTHVHVCVQSILCSTQCAQCCMATKGRNPLGELVGN